MRRRILFVDDEENILDGLRNRLRRQRGAWDMVFALGGAAALEELSKAPFDVIVSDMRMAGMSGAALLRSVKAKWPEMARMVLSGHADQAATLEVLPFVHQYLSKPCNADDLCLAIERVCGLQALLPNDNIRRVVGGLDKLPSIPRAYAELARAVNDPETPLPELARIVESDSAMSIKVLQMVNSAYFGLARKVNTVADAIVLLGPDLLRGLATSTQVFSAERLPEIEGFSMDRLQKESLLRARLARRFVADPQHADEAFTAGLLHDSGTIALATVLPDAFAAILKEARETGRPQNVVEREHLGFTHAEIGAYLQGMWGLPHAIVQAVAHHHAPGDLTSGSWDVVGALHVADAMAHLLTEGADRASGRARSGRSDGLDLDFLEQSGLLAHLTGWRDIAAMEAGGGVN